jgi:hypothetical protein
MAEKRKQQDGGFNLAVPVDASQIEGFKPEQEIKVVAQQQDGSLISQTTKLNEKGQGAVTLAFDKHPGTLRLFVGPGTAADDELLGMQTISLTVASRLWQETNQLTLTPIVISAYYWYWWLYWCRTFTIRGRVLCPDGRPVPGAQVCAYDVDRWWWWSSIQQVGCATTDAFGAFEIKFRWCCGWWPWWWWERRFWRLEQSLVDRILPALQGMNLKQLPLPSPKPDLAIFEDMLPENGALTLPPGAAVNPAALDNLRGHLIERLPVIRELEPLRLWPWWPWWPWWDCNPDIIFHVTQNCQGQEKVIVDETIWDTRWDVPTTLTVTLVANDQACCIDDPPPPPGNCMVISEVCNTVVNNIGGNPGAPAAPAGYANPGLVARFGDRPYAGGVNIAGLFGSGAAVDYYEFEWATNPAGPWNPMPPFADGAFSRSYWGPQLGGGPVGFYSVPFPATNIGGQNVYESREHFEANNDPLSWGVTRFWVSNRDMLTVWLTNNNFADGTYYLQVKSWSRPGYVGNLSNPRILLLCDTEQQNRLVLTLDNQVMAPPNPPQPCMPASVHICTNEPNTAIVAVRINGHPAAACAIVDAKGGGTLEIDFVAHDPDDHLAYYTLEAHYDVNSVVDLLAASGATLSSAPAVGPVPSAAQVGPDYKAARTLPQTASSPIWAGGSLRLTIPDLRNAFQESCCYQLKLVAYKRTIVDCYGGAAHYNITEYSLTVVV